MDNLQLVVTVLGIVGQLLALVKYIPKTSGETTGSTAAPSTAPARESGGRRLLDLSFVLLCSTFLSLILTDSLIISGRAPSPGFGTTMAVVTIVVVIFSVMYAAWRLNQSEKVIGFLSLLTLAVLILSPGGPFGGSSPDSGAKDIQQGLNLYVPLLTLVTLVCAMVIYSYGSPLSATLELRKRSLVAATLVFLVVAGSGALGRHLVTAVMKDDRTPKIDAPEVASLLRTLTSWDAITRHRFYQLGAEIALAGEYQGRYRALRDAQDKVKAAEEKARGSDSTEPRWASLHFTPAGSHRMGVLFERIADMSSDSRRGYLLRRLDWVHPVGAGRTQFSLPLAGLSARDRFENLGTLRLLHVLDEQPIARADLFLEFSTYPATVINRYVPNAKDRLDQGSAGQSIPNVIKSFLPNTQDERFRLAALPKFDTTDEDRQLQLQLSLPSEIESALAFGAYSGWALQLVRERNRNPQDTPLYDKVAESFNALSPESQNALRRYVASDEDPLETIKALAALSDIDFSALAMPNTSARYALEVNLRAYGSKDLPATPPEGDPLKKLAYDIASKRNRDAAKAFERLLSNDDRAAPLHQLFQAKVFDFVKTVDALSAATKKDFFEAAADPVWLVVRELARTVVPNQTDQQFFDVPLATFRKTLSPARQDDVLHHLAISIYQPEAEYSLDPFSQLVVQARVLSNTAAVVCASFFMLPVLILCVIAGGFVSRRLVARDRMRELVAGEVDGFTDPTETVGQPVKLFGRADVLRDLRSLAERGWSTIGVVGRRGVGKSRILHALSQAGEDEAVTPSVRVWVASPSRFEETDFIASIFERLALSAEAAIAAFLGTKPLAIRRLDSRSTRIGMWYYTGALALLLIVMYQMYERLTRADIIITWLPIAALLFGSVSLLVRHLFLLQPVDLTAWLQRDRAHNPHTVLLYGEVNEALKFLRQRTRLFSAPQAAQPGLLSAVGTSAASMLIALLSLVGFFIFLSEFDELWWVALTLGGVALGFWVLRQKALAQDLTTRHGESMMSLIAEYRTFAAMIVYRLKQGALGHSAERRFSVLVCIDELDKIVEFEEIRGFVRRIKAIFEVPGVYYYVSLAEDTLTALYLGSATGKNEIDSSFDHVVRIPPLTCAQAEAAAATYLAEHAPEAPPPRAARVIATLSYGIPRDVIRRCDEYMARTEDLRTRHGDLIAELRKMQAALGYELRQLSSADVTALSAPGHQAALAARQYLAGTAATETEASQRLVLSILVLALIEAASQLPDDGWIAFSERLCAIGYKLPVERVADLIVELDPLHADVVLASRTGTVAGAA